MVEHVKIRLADLDVPAPWALLEKLVPLVSCCFFVVVVVVCLLVCLVLLQCHTMYDITDCMNNCYSNYEYEYLTVSLILILCSY